MLDPWLSLLPPEALGVLAYIGWGALAAGLLLWAFGVKVARPMTALALGTLGAVVLIWLAPSAGIGISNLAAGAIGVVIGFISGLLSFRMLQAFGMATALAVLVAGLYYHQHVSPTLTNSPPVVTAVSLHTPSADLPLVASLNLPDQPEPNGTRFDDMMAQGEMMLRAVVSDVHNFLAAIPPRDLTRMAIAGAGTMIVALLLAFAFPRLTTAALSAACGAALAVLAILLIAHAYAPELLARAPHDPKLWWSITGALAIVGLVFQWRFLMRRADNRTRRAKPAPAPAAAPVAA